MTLTVTIHDQEILSMLRDIAQRNACGISDAIVFSLQDLLEVYRDVENWQYTSTEMSK